MGTGTLTWPSVERPSPFWAAIGDWLRIASGVERRPPNRAAGQSAPQNASQGAPHHSSQHSSQNVPANSSANAPPNEPSNASPGRAGTRRRAAPTRLFREVATRSLGRAAFEPLPVFIPEGAAELSSWLDLPRDRQALLSAIAARLDADSQEHLRTLLSGGLLAQRDLAGDGDLLSHMAELFTEPMGPGCDQTALLEAAIRSFARPETLRAATWIVWLARRAPAELARLITGLASPKGYARLRSGEVLLRSQRWLGSTGDVLGRLLGSAHLDRG